VQLLDHRVSWRPAMDLAKMFAARGPSAMLASWNPRSSRR